MSAYARPARVRAVPRLGRRRRMEATGETFIGRRPVDRSSDSEESSELNSVDLDEIAAHRHEDLFRRIAV